MLAVNSSSDEATASSGPASQGFRLAFLGKQAINRPTNTGFGSVQKSLRDIYLAAVGGGGAKIPGDKLSERTVGFDGHSVQIRFWDPGARRFQQEVWPMDCVNYLDLVMFETVRGKKREFGYFRRHTDSTEVVPDSVLIPLHKKEAKSLAKLGRQPLLCFLIRRPYGIQFLECHVFQVGSIAEGQEFIAAFDRHSRAKLQDEKRSQVFNYDPFLHQQQQQLTSHHRLVDSGFNKWASQPALSLLQPEVQQQQLQLLQQHQQHQQQQEQNAQIVDRNAPLAVAMHYQSAVNVSNFRAAAVATPESASGAGSSASSERRRTPPDSSQAIIHRSASGTIFDKYKELRAFDIPESEYMGFEEVQQQLEIRRQQRVPQQLAEQQLAADQNSAVIRPNHQQHLQPDVSTKRGSLAVSSQKFPSDGNIFQQHQQPPIIQRRIKAAPPSTQAAAIDQNRPSTILEEGFLSVRNSTTVEPTPPPPPKPSTDAPDGVTAASVASLINRFERIKQHQYPQQQQQQQFPAPVNSGGNSSPPITAQSPAVAVANQVVVDQFGRPVARVPPMTSVSAGRPPPEHQQNFDKKSQPASAVANQDQRRHHVIHRSASSRVSQKQESASGSGYEKQQQQQQQQQQKQQQLLVSQKTVVGSTPDLVALGLGYLP